jgi:hypothetical protein
MGACGMFKVPFRQSQWWLTILHGWQVFGIREFLVQRQISLVTMAETGRNAAQGVASPLSPRGESRMAEKISRATAEAYVGIAIAVFVGVFPVTWWAKIVLMVIVGGLAVDIAFRSPKTINLHWLKKVGLSLLSIGVLSVISYFPIRKQYVEDNAGTLDGDLHGAGEVFTNEKSRAVPAVEIGDSKSILYMTPSKPGQPVQPYFIPFPDAEFRTEYGKNGPMVSTTVRDGDGHIVATIDNNHWNVYPPYCSDKNYTDHALEILDASLHVVLQIRIFPNEVQVQGEWWDNQGKGLRIVKSPLELKPGALVLPLSQNNRKNDVLIKPIFRYPSKYHWREFLH